MAEKLTLAESREIAEKLLNHFRQNEMEEFWRVLDERVLHQKVMEKYLAALARTFQEDSLKDPDTWLLICDTIVERKTDSAYSLSSIIMNGILRRRMKECFDRSRIYLSDTRRWFSSDVYALHVVCEGLKHDFAEAIGYVRDFTNDPSVWVRRCVGIAVYHYARQVKNMPERISVLLDVLKDLIREKDVRVAKGVGWGLRSIGASYPDQLVRFAKENFARKRVSKLLFRVSVANLPLEDKEELLEHWMSTRTKR
jgi:3-methyladenine DNA glycosylase AlkD